MRALRLRMLSALSPISISSASTVRGVEMGSPPEMGSPQLQYMEKGDRMQGASSCFSAAGGSGATVLKRPSAAMAKKVARTSEVWELSSDDGEAMFEEEKLTKVAKVKSSKAKKMVERKEKEKEGNKQGRIEGAKVTKPGRKTKEAKEKVAKTKKERTPVDDDEPLGLEKVVPRRKDWTPVKNRTAGIVSLLDVDGYDTMADDAAATGYTCRTDSQNALQNLLDNFGYASESSRATFMQPQKISEQLPPLKKRKLNLVESAVPVKPLATVTKKGKAPKKKARTITELTTREFMPIDDVLARSGSFMDSFVTHQSRKEDTLGSDVEAEAIDRGRKSLKLTKTKAKAKSKLAVQPKSRLLDPERALEAVESQELLFGTSSQLVREDSPGFIRDLQHALKESEASASQQDADTGVSDLPTVGKSLWSAATRNIDGSLLEAEAVDLTKTPKYDPRRSSSNIGAFQTTSALLAPDEPSFVEETSAMNEESPHFPATTSAQSPSPAPVLEPPTIPSLNPEDSIISLPKSIAEAACRARPRSKSPTKKATKTTKATKADDGSAPVKKPKAKRKANDMTDLNSWTVPELTKQIKDFGFKPVKGKAAMVALLEKCRESLEEREKGKEDERPVLKQLDVNEKSPHFGPVDGKDVEEAKSKGKGKAKKSAQQGEDAAAAVVPKKRGRPRKVVDAGSPAIVTSTDAQSSSKPSASTSTTQKSAEPTILAPSSPPSSPRKSPKTATKSTIKASKTTASPDSDAALLSAITQAITTFPPTHDPKNFSWYEKILLYDPIVLEDLTVWLNTTGLGRIGADEEVWPALVRTWCEGRSVCCLWRENLRGGKRARY